MSKSERYRQKIRELEKLKENIRCINCGELSNHVVLQFGIFTCAICANVHRQLHSGVKGISQSTFTRDDYRSLEQGGNAKAKKIYFQGLSEDDLPQRGSKDDEAFLKVLRPFIMRVYDGEKASPKSIQSEDSKHKQHFGRARTSSISRPRASSFSTRVRSGSVSSSGAPTKPSENVLQSNETQKKNVQPSNQLEDFFGPSVQPTQNQNSKPQPTKEDERQNKRANLLNMMDAVFQESQPMYPQQQPFPQQGFSGNPMNFQNGMYPQQQPFPQQGFSGNPMNMRMNPGMNPQQVFQSQGNFNPNQNPFGNMPPSNGQYRPPQPQNGNPFQSHPQQPQNANPFQTVHNPGANNPFTQISSQQSEAFSHDQNWRNKNVNKNVDGFDDTLFKMKQQSVFKQTTNWK